MPTKKKAKKKKVTKSYKRILGLELGGSKSNRTSLVFLKYYPKEKKIFLGDCFSHIQADDEESGDTVLVKLIKKHKAKVVGINAPTNFPPCLFHPCKGLDGCFDPQVQWMREEVTRQNIPLNKIPTPYTQRAIDVAMRTRVQPRFDVDLHFEETLGAGRAPLAARFRYLIRFFQQEEFLEVHPRLAVAAIADWFKLTKRELRRYRSFQYGLENRILILQKLERDLSKFKIPHLFLYDTDLELLAQDLNIFDAFINALMAVYYQADLLGEIDSDFDSSWGYIALPPSAQEMGIPK